MEGTGVNRRSPSQVWKFAAFTRLREFPDPSSETIPCSQSGKRPIPRKTGRIYDMRKPRQRRAFLMIDSLTLDYSDVAPSPWLRVLLVDDHAVVRKGLTMLINGEDGMQVCGEAEDERGARDAAARLRPDVAVVDWSLGQRDASGLIGLLHQSYPEMRILVLSMHDELLYAERVLRLGANGYVMKQDAADRVIEGIRRISEGHTYLTDRARDSLSTDLTVEIAIGSRQNLFKEAARHADLPAPGGVGGKADLVIAPHPDDETFGCGGTIRLVTESGTPVDVVFMTRGELGHEEGQAISPQQQVELAEKRTAEAIQACKALGVRRVFFLDGNDTQLKDQGHLAGDLLSVLVGNGYRRIFCPWKHDGHADHQATFALLQTALKGYPQPLQLWLYEVWAPLSFNMLIPIDHTIRHKKAAIDQYRTQLPQLNYREGFIGLSAYRSAFCPPATFAEAFFVCSKEEALLI